MAPDWLPQRSIAVQVIRDGKADGAPIKLKRAATALVSLPMDESGGHYELQLSPTFVPARLGLGNDQRELSVMLKRCSILADNSSSIQLFPEKTSA
jgi:hypothetical protein